MQSKDSEIGKWGEEVCQREPLENPSCLTHLCPLDATKLACSASDYFFVVISLPLSLPVPAFFVIPHFFLFTIQSEFVCFWKRRKSYPPPPSPLPPNPLPLLLPPYIPCVPHQLWCGLTIACMCVLVRLALAL